MIWNYIKYAFRNLVKQRGRTLINILGLSFGIACVIIIYLYSSRELSFNKFHTNRDRIYRMYMTVTSLQDEEFKATYFPPGMARALKEKLPSVVHSCRLQSTGAWIGKGEVLFQERIGFTDSTFLEMFTFHVLAGDPVHPLAFPQSLVLTETVANKFFGDSISDYNEIIGESIEFPQRPPNEFTITAVIADPPDNNSFKFTVLVPYENVRQYPRCNNLFGSSSIYLMLDEHNDNEQAEESAQLLIEEFHGEALETLAHYGYVKPDSNDFRYRLQPFSDLYLDSENMISCYEWTGNKKSIYILSSIAILILLIACFNYVMISIGSSLNRIGDFGVMNVVGARTGQLLGHFISESFLLTLISMFLGIILAEQILPLFNQLAREDLQFTLYGDWENILFLVLVLLLIVGLTSSYIGLYLLRNNQPLRFLRKELLSLRRNGVARISVILQYFIAISLLISSGVILKQLKHITNQDVGFSLENLIVISVDFPEQKIYTLKERMLQSPHIESVSTSDRTFTSGSSSTAVMSPSGETFELRLLRADPDYIDALGLELLEGRNFFPDETIKENYNVIVNEAFIKAMGLEDPIGKQVILEQRKFTITIIGVVRDFHFDSMHDEIMPLMLHLYRNNSIWAVFVKLGANVSDGLRDIEKAWNEIVPEYEYNYTFMADNLESQYEDEDRWSRIIAYASLIAIFLSCLGLMGISGLLVARRFKEVGIRKANGATVAQILYLLNFDILKWVLIAFLVASPASYFIMRRWLQDFAYKTSISWWIFALAGIIALLISMLTISLQIYRAARQNPVNALRYE